MGRTLAGAGFAEVISFPFVGQAAYDLLGLPADDPRRDSLRVANPLSTEAPLLTTTLLPGLLEAGARNSGRGNPDVSLFEITSVTRPEGAKPAPMLPVDRRPTPEEWEELLAALPQQPLHLGLLLAGEVERPGWWGPGRAASWSDAVETIRHVAAGSGDRAAGAAGRSGPVAPGAVRGAARRR